MENFFYFSYWFFVYLDAPLRVLQKKIIWNLFNFKQVSKNSYLFFYL